MNLDELRSVQSKERQKDSLQNLRPSFYREVGEYIAELKAERDRAAEAAADPFSSPEVGQLTDEIETAKDVVEAIYERRMGKLVKQASLAAAGMPADDEGLTEEEAELFTDLIDRIRTNKGRVLDVLEWSEEAADGADVEVESQEPTPDDPAAAGAEPAEPSESEGVSVADAMGGDLEERSPATGTDSASGTEETEGASGVEDGLDSEEIIDEFDADPGSGPDSPPTAGTDPSPDPGSETPASGGNEPADEPDAQERREPSADGGEPTLESGAGDVERVTVRITRDVGSILGVDDREYSLADDDVVTLPERNATPLLERDAAEPLE